MVETKVVLCDSCKKMVSSDTCDFCGVDLCENCKQRNKVDITGIVTLNYINYCKLCYNRIGKAIQDPYTYKDQAFVTALKSLVINEIKKKIITNKL